MKSLRGLLPRRGIRPIALRRAAEAIDPVAFNLKSHGYALARQLAAALPPIGDAPAEIVGLHSKAATQADLESNWARHWLGELKSPLIFHRKLWEHAYVLQAMHEAGVLRPGARALGFGCGQEPVASYLASRELELVITDLPPDHASTLGWRETGQYADTLSEAFYAHLVDRSTFDRCVSVRAVDMNAVPRDLQGFDACWSICAMEHLGSIAKGLAFVERAMDCLKPGGVAVHTMEYNVRHDGRSFDRSETVLFRRCHLEELARRLAARGHVVAPFDFDLGQGPLDRFVDIPPFSHKLPPELNDWLGQQLHLKLAIASEVVTCFGLIVRKGAQ